MLVIGIDPGLTGALAAVQSDGRLTGIDDMPLKRERGKKRDDIDVAALASILRGAGAVDHVLVVVERVAAAPGAGVGGMFRFGYGAGAIEGCCRALGCRLELVAPAVWKGALRLPGGQENKGLALEKARRIWPDKADWFKRQKDAGRAEAALIALWAIMAGKADGLASAVS